MVVNVESAVRDAKVPKFRAEVMAWLQSGANAPFLLSYVCEILDVDSDCDAGCDRVAHRGWWKRKYAPKVVAVIRLLHCGHDGGDERGRGKCPV